MRGETPEVKEVAKTDPQLFGVGIDAYQSELRPHPRFARREYGTIGNADSSAFPVDATPGRRTVIDAWTVRRVGSPRTSIAV